ncbi:FAD-binding oxidoreductase [Pelagivirga sediminicola]|uniref:FAD-binding oxidoreductase n=1 Tax=Pelagivirga sediminicola TaxID=2170575 RepID=A0A2T7G7H9_9RHOB|nr:FAD-binding oxidoreductase [Pelagivirga sediminicola]PVA10373.1 FAD-binding oxidoreductase [Pelagivirga sediminicola]
MLDRLREILGAANVLTGKDMDPFACDWSGAPQGTPLAVLRPGSTADVAAILKLANESRTPVVPMSGNTCLSGATAAEGAWVVSMARMNKIREIRPTGRIAIVEAGAILANIHDAVAEHDLIFPLFFGARGSAMIGGALSTNAGGSNVLRYGNTRDLCLGIEAVLPDGEVIDLMRQLHKDNSGYDLRHLLIGAEGTLGIITAAVIKLFPAPLANATAMVAVPRVGDALELLNRLQQETGGAVQAFEYMPRAYIETHLLQTKDARPPFDERHDVNIMVEVGATAPRDAVPDANGQIPIAAHLESVLADLFEEGAILDAVVAQNETQRREMWERREAAAQVMTYQTPHVDRDIAVPVDRMQEFLDQVAQIIADLDPGAQDVSVAHLGDGNLHLGVFPTRDDEDLCQRIGDLAEDAAVALGGSFSAEHGIGWRKRPAMARHKNPGAMAAMRTIKTALDPNGILNPGKVLPDI